MTDIIVNKLHEIEKRENVKILFAVEAGSRAWGFASPDSDYDVRFVYVRPLEYYLGLEKKRDVLTYPINDLLDIHGWDLSKALFLLHNANPTLFEWCASAIVYMETPFFDVFKKLALSYFSSQTGVYYYASMAEGNYRQYLKGETVKAKKYFYVLRPVLACRWILEKGTPPPILFTDLVSSQLPSELTDDVNHLLNLKIHAPEIKWIPRIECINHYLDVSIAQIRQKAMQMISAKEKDWDELNRVFISTVKEYS